VSSTPLAEVAALVVASHATIACRASRLAYPLWRAQSGPNRA